MHRKGNDYILYDLSVDEKELVDVADKYPEKAEEMKTKMESWNSSLPDAYEKGKRRN